MDKLQRVISRCPVPSRDAASYALGCLVVLRIGAVHCDGGHLGTARQSTYRAQPKRLGASDIDGGSRDEEIASQLSAPGHGPTSYSGFAHRRCGSVACGSPVLRRAIAVARELRHLESHAASLSATATGSISDGSSNFTLPMRRPIGIASISAAGYGLSIASNSAGSAGFSPSHAA